MVSHPLRRPLALSSSPFAFHGKSGRVFEVSDERVRWSMVDIPFAFPPSLLLPRLYSALQARGLHCSIRLCLPPSLHPCVTHARTVRNSMGAWNTCAGWTNAPPGYKEKGQAFSHSNPWKKSTISTQPRRPSPEFLEVRKKSERLRFPLAGWTRGSIGRLPRS